MASPYPKLLVLKVSHRDREIYERVVVQSQPQRQVGLLFKLSQPRICQIVARVARWLSETVPVGLDEVPRPQRLYAVARTYKMKLDYYEQRAMEAFDKSQEMQYVVSGEIVDGKATGKEHYQRKTGRADVKLLLAAKGFAAAKVEFEGFAPNGAVARNNDDRLHEPPELSTEKEIDRFILVAKRMDADREALRAEQRREAEMAASSAASSTVATHPEVGLSTTSPEVGSVSANVHPNEFANDLFVGENVANEPAEVRAELGAMEKGGEPGASRGAARQEPRPPVQPRPPEPSQIPADPPPPRGFVRRGDRCYPYAGFGFMKENGRFTSLPGMPAKLPAYYTLDEDSGEWLPSFTEW